MSTRPDGAVRVGIVGTGDLGTRVGDQIRSHPNGVITAVTDVNPEALKRAGNQFDVPSDQRYDTCEALLESAPIDAVLIATPHTFHYEQTIAALEHGFDVLCEKPLTVDLERARDVVERSEDDEQILMVGYQRHLYPPFLEAKQRLHASDGKPAYITAETTQEWIEPFRNQWRGNPDLSGGGQLYDTGSHLIDAVLWVADVRPKSVHAEMTFDDDAQRVDKHAALSVRFQNGAVGSITVSGDTRHRYEHLHFTNDDGGVRIEDQQRLFEYDGTGDRSEVSVDRGSQRTKGSAFVDAVLKRATPPSTARHAFAVTALTEAAYESARTGQRIDIEPLPPLEP